jgi:hypothetical protein
MKRRSFEVIRMENSFIMKVEKNGMHIPIEKLKGINERDIVEVQIRRVYVDEKTKIELETMIREIRHLLRL